MAEQRTGAEGGDGLPGVWLVRGVTGVLVFGVVLGVYLLIGTPTLPNEQERTGAAAPTAPANRGTLRPSATPAPQGTPAEPQAASPAPSPAAEARRHTIRSGDTLLSIAEQYDTTVDAIRAANPGLSETALQIGGEITIPPGR